MAKLIQNIRWSMGSRITKELALDSFLMAVWRRQPGGKVLVHSDQERQYTSYDWNEFLSAHGLEGSMSRRGNCHGRELLSAAKSRLVK